MQLAILSGCSSAAATAIAATAEPVKADPLIISEGRVEPIQFAEIGFNSSGALKEVLVRGRRHSESRSGIDAPRQRRSPASRGGPR